jgi:small-conductance mechanosensitive channel
VEGAQDLFKQMDAIFQLQFLPLGKTRVSLWMITYIAILVSLLVIVTGRLRDWMEQALSAHTSIDVGLRQGIATIARYVAIFFGSLVILQTAGIDLSSFTVLAGALGLGVSFGLQTITTNLVSGLIILFERPIKIGDRIEVDGVTGDVIRISLRATTIVTNDNIAIIVPNSEFIKGKVTNWSYTSDRIRFSYPVPVALDADPIKAAEVILRVANEHPGVLKSPPADVLFNEFGQNAFNFSLRVYTEEYLTKPNSLRSELYYSIHKALTKQGSLAYKAEDIDVQDINKAIKAVSNDVIQQALNQREEA